MPKFNWYVPGNRFDDDQAFELFENILVDQQSFLDLAAMDVGVSTKGLHVAGVPIGNDAWDTKLVVKRYKLSFLTLAK